MNCVCRTYYIIHIPVSGASVLSACLHACELDALYPASITADLICTREGVLQ